MATSEIFGLEIVSVYYGEADAEDSWNVARGKSTGVAGSVMSEPDGLALEFINEQIRKKAQKRYSYPHAIVLVLDGRLPLSDELDIDEIVAQVRAPDKLPFKEVFLGVTLGYGRPSPRQGQYRIWRLYPKALIGLPSLGA